MSDETPDPYRMYLGLAPGPRPPHHYELLGLELFCSHHERINQAARKQFRIIKGYHDQYHRPTREAIQDIMNAIATARVVLTDPDRKEAYDAALAERLDVDRDAHLAAQVAAPLPEFELTVIAGPSLVENRFELVEGTRFTVGCDPKSLLALNPGRAAERHCVIHHVDGEWLLRPTDPQLLIEVNNVATKEFVLVDGDQIDVGGYRLLFSAIRRREELRDARVSCPAPLSLIIQKGPAIPAPILNALPPQRMVIGQGDSALWQLPDHTVSRSHCAVQSVGDRWEIEDLESTNGTLVNGTEIMRHLLNDRDVVTIGGFDIVVSIRL